MRTLTVSGFCFPPPERRQANGRGEKRCVMIGYTYIHILCECLNIYIYIY